MEAPGDFVRDREGRVWRIAAVRRLVTGILHDVHLEDPATGYVRIASRREFWSDYWDIDAEAAGEEFRLPN